MWWTNGNDINDDNDKFIRRKCGVTEAKCTYLQILTPS